MKFLGRYLCEAAILGRFRCGLRCFLRRTRVLLGGSGGSSDEISPFAGNRFARGRKLNVSPSGVEAYYTPRAVFAVGDRLGDFERVRAPHETTMSGTKCETMSGLRQRLVRLARRFCTPRFISPGASWRRTSSSLGGS